MMCYSRVLGFEGVKVVQLNIIFWEFSNKDEEKDGEMLEK